jgi:CheY-like chemotaxis protein
MKIPKVLLADDVELFLDLEKAFLAKSPVTILTAHNGREALDLARTVRPDLIYLDLYMPEMDGAACCAALKTDPELRSIPVIMVTAEGKGKDQEVCRQAGCDGIVTKPIDRREFLAAGHSVLFTIDRREARVPCRTPVFFTLGEESYYSESVDISFHGVYVAFNQSVRRELPVGINFVLPGTSSDLIEAWGRVAWVNPPLEPVKPGFPLGFGVEFRQLTVESSDHLRRFIESHAGR